MVKSKISAVTAVKYDYSDAPATYGAPAHAIVAGMHIGAADQMAKQRLCQVLAQMVTIPVVVMMKTGSLFLTDAGSKRDY